MVHIYYKIDSLFFLLVLLATSCLYEDATTICACELTYCL